MSNTLQSLLEIPQNRLVLNHLIRQVQSDEGIDLFIGQRFGNDAGYQLWRDFLKRLTGKETHTLAEQDEAITDLMSRLPDFQLRDMIEDAYADYRSEGDFSFLNRLGAEKVFTTCLHNIVEKFVPRQMLPDRQSHYALQYPVIKIRGSASSRTDLALTSADFRSRLRPPSRTGQLFSVAMSERSFLIAYLTSPDDLVLDRFEAEKRPDKVHYIIAPFRALNDRQDQIDSLAAKNLRSIGVPGDDPLSHTHTILRYLADQLRPASAPPELVTSPAAVSIPLPSTPAGIEIPNDLVEKCASGECILSAASGLSARAGLPTYRDFFVDLLDWALDAKRISDRDARVQLAALLAGNRSVVADNVYSLLGGENARLDLVEFCRRKLKTPAQLPKSHGLLRKLPFAGVVTSNFDSVLEATFRGTLLDNILTARDSEQLLSALTQSKPFLAKLYGSLDAPETMFFAPAEFQAYASSNTTLTQFLEGTFYSRTLLFMGSSVESIAEYLRSLPLRGVVPRTHYAFIWVQGDAWEATADALERRYNIKVIPYRSEDHHEVDSFLEELVRKVEERAGSRSAAHAQTAPATGKLRELELRNVGPFEHLKLPLDAGWTVLLGDNGVGKSNILKALGVAVVGKDAEPWAHRLIRSGQNLAQIIVRTDRNPEGYITDITRRENRAVVEPKPVRLLDAEHVLTLGFPPLRTVSWDPINGPMTELRSRPSADDVIPLLRGEPDPRLDRLKQWIVGLFYRSLNKEVQQTHPPRAVLDHFFEIVGDLMGEQELHFVGVTESYEVQIGTSDGVVPVQALSQGMTSLLSWIGILVQRLYEVNPERDHPASQPAIVLMDEMDAHMHPAWQQKLVFHLKRLFPQVQFVVSTHSPLIAQDLDLSELRRLSRSPEGKVVLLELEGDQVKGSRADQILTEPEFGLFSSLPYSLQMDMDEYTKLLGMPEDQRDQRRFFALQKNIESRVGPSAHTALGRRAQVLADGVLVGRPALELREAAKAVVHLLEKEPNL